MRASSWKTSSTRRARCWSEPRAYGQRVAARGFAMFNLQEIRRAHEVVLQALRPTPALNWPLLDDRLGAEAVVKHENHLPTGAFKVRGGADLRRCAHQARSGCPRAHFGDARQSRPESCLRRAACRASGDDRRPAGQFDREKRGYASARRRIDRVRARLSGGARGGDAAREQRAICTRFRRSTVIWRSASRPTPSNF